MRHAFCRANFANLLATRYPLAMRELRAEGEPRATSVRDRPQAAADNSRSMTSPPQPIS